MLNKSRFKLEEGKAVCFDFDGVIHKYSKGWQDGSIYDEYNENVIEIINFLQKAKIPVFICSTRNPLQIVEWWNKHLFWPEAVLINDNVQFWKNPYVVGVTNVKLPAQLYIDDRGYRYDGQTIKQFIEDNSNKEE